MILSLRRIAQLCGCVRQALPAALLLGGSLLAPTLARAQQEVSVDQFTGTAHVTIPLASLEVRGLSLALSLNYAAQGMQVNERGGFVGVGWNLVGLPSISREVRGLPDDFRFVGPNPANAENPERFGWLTAETQVHVRALTPTWPEFEYPLFVSADCSALPEQHAASVAAAFERTPPGAARPASMWDSEPDVFSYAVPGHVGRFVFDNTGRARTFPFDPITITYDNARTDSLGTCINSFIISTPEGNIYQFSTPDITHKQSVWTKQVYDANHPANLPTTIDVKPSLFQRDFYYYRLLIPAAYATTWHITTMRNSAREQIAFSYLKHSFIDGEFWYNPSSIRINYPLVGIQPEYSWLLKNSTRRLTAITSPTAFINLRSSQQDTTNYLQTQAINLQSLVTGYRGQRGNTVTKTLQFIYDEVRPTENPYFSPWVNTEGTEIFLTHYNPGGSLNFGFLTQPRRFLRELRTSTACGNPLTYKFKYHALEPFSTSTSIPPPSGAYRDYWGHFRFDFVEEWFCSGEVPELYSYASLSPQSVPGAPFRLYPLPSDSPTNTSGASRLPSDNAVPAFSNTPNPAGETCFQRSTLLGTLEDIRLPTGGRITLEYEPHQLHDPVVELLNPTAPAFRDNAYIGPGVRARAIVLTDNVTGVVSRREYRYTASDGKSSGRLLWTPTFSFQRPFSADWVHTTENLADHTFEDRTMGYGRVTELVAGRGQTVTTFALDGDADAVAANPSRRMGNAPGSQLPSWRRSVVGPARSDGPNGGSCTTFSTPYTPGYETYPFPPSTNYDFWRGQPLSTVSYAEPAGLAPAAGAEVQRTTYQYTFRNLSPAAAPVVGWAYDGVSKMANNVPVANAPRAYVMARYELLTDFQLAIRQETTTRYDQSAPTVGHTASTRYAYNSQGQLAAVVRSASDGGVVRTRYKYLADYNIPAFSAALSPSLQALAHRFHEEKLTGDLLETITEIAPPGTTGARLAGVILNTFRQDDPAAPTRPYQTLRWQSTTPLPHSQYPADTTGVVGQAWQVSPRLRAETTVEEVGADLRQLPLTVSQRAGNIVKGLHLGYRATVPVLQIAHAYASEARFSNFEDLEPGDAQYAWQAGPGTTRTSAAARTGEQGLRLDAGAALSTPLPVPAVGTQLPPVAPSVRLSGWVRAPAAGQLTVQLGRPAEAPVLTKNVAVGATTDWQLIEVPLLGLSNLGITPTNRSEFTVRLLNAGGQAVDVDDVLLLPSTATARSLTYNHVLGQKTSETNEAGQTTYFEYTAAGRLRTVHDHQGNLVRRIDQTVGGHNVDESPLDFTISDASGGDALYEDRPLTFTALGLCEDVVSYRWNFGCAGANCVSTDPSPTFQYPVTPRGNSDYTVTLQVTTAHGTQTVTHGFYLHTAPPPPVQYSTCVSGAVEFDVCGTPLAAPLNTCFHAGLPPPDQTRFKVTVSNPNPGITYWWEVRLPDSDNPAVWRDPRVPYANSSYVIGSITSNSLLVPHTRHSAEYRCVIINGEHGATATTAASANFIIIIRNPNTTCN